MSGAPENDEQFTDRAYQAMLTRDHLDDTHVPREELPQWRERYREEWESLTPAMREALMRPAIPGWRQTDHGEWRRSTSERANYRAISREPSVSAFRWATASSRLARSTYGPAVLLGGLVGFICASPVMVALPGQWASILLVFGLLILLGGVVGVLAALLVERIIGSAGWPSYAVIFAAPLIIATIPRWMGTIGAIVIAVALLGGAFIGRYIVHRPEAAAD